MAKETIYEHISGADYFTVTAAERWSVGMIKRLKEKSPDSVEIVAENKDGSIVARFPQEWMRISPKRKRELTDEQRKELADRLKNAREKGK